MKAIILLLIGLFIASLLRADDTSELIYYDYSQQSYFPPYGWTHPDTLQFKGYARELFDLLGEKLLLPVEGRVYDQPSAQLARLAVGKIADGETDLGLFPRHFMPPHDNIIVIEEPFYTMQTKLFVLKGNEKNIHSYQDLSNHLGGHLESFSISGNDDFDQYASEHLNFKRYPTYFSMVDALLKGEVDYLVAVNKPVLLALQLQHKRKAVVAIGESLSELDIVLVISSQSHLSHKADAINRLLQQYRDNGRLQFLLNQSMQEYVSYYRHTND